MERQNLLYRLQSMIASGLETTIDGVVACTVVALPADSPVQRQQAIDDIIDSAARKAAGISFQGALLPGLAGLYTLAPCLIGVSREQLGLVRDVAYVSSRGQQPSSAFVLGMIASTLGRPDPQFPLHPAQVQMRPPGGAALHGLSLQVALGIAQQAGAAAVSRWLPGIGAAALGVWSGYTTRRIGRSTQALFAGHEPTLSLQSPVAAVSTASSPSLSNLLEVCKLQVLIGLARVDGRVCEQEQAYLQQALADPQLGEDDRVLLRAMLAGEPVALNGLERLAKHPDAAVALMANMAVLAWRDGQLHGAERAYARHIGSLLGVAREDVDELLADAGSTACAVSA